VRETQAAIKIQKHWRRYQEKKKKEKTRKAFAVLNRLNLCNFRVFKKYISLRRKLQYHRGADIVRGFFHDLHDVSRLIKVIKRFRFSVIQAQRISKRYVLIFNAQVALILMQWGRLEAFWWSQKQGGESLEDEGNSKDRK
jgi:hypothetical protein